jgi:hypothetical protein
MVDAMSRTTSEDPWGRRQAPLTARLATLRAIVADYVAEYRPREWVAFHRRQRPRRRALEVVASWKDECGKIYSHQCLVPRAAKAEAGRRIRALQFAGIRCFDELFQRVQDAIGGIRGVGELTVYDVAARIGASLGMMPDRVYLQSGAKRGARLLLNRAVPERSLPKEAFPHEFQWLKSWEIEDVLCIYKAAIEQIARRRAA